MDQRQKLTDQQADQAAGGNMKEFVEEHKETVETVATCAAEGILNVTESDINIFKKVWNWFRKRG